MIDLTWMLLWEERKSTTRQIFPRQSTSQANPIHLHFKFQMNTHVNTCPQQCLPAVQSVQPLMWRSLQHQWLLEADINNPYHQSPPCRTKLQSRVPSVVAFMCSFHLVNCYKDNTRGWAGFNPHNWITMSLGLFDAICFDGLQILCWWF